MNKKIVKIFTTELKWQFQPYKDKDFPPSIKTNWTKLRERDINMFVRIAHQLDSKFDEIKFRKLCYSITDNP